MATLTAPFDIRALSDIAQSLEATHSIYATDRAGNKITDLELTEGGLTLTLDEAWSPYAQLEASVAVLNDMRQIDPRKAHRIVVELGYKYPGGVLDQHVVADLVLSEWQDRYDGTATIMARSDEQLLMEWESLGAVASYPAGATAVDVIRLELARTLGVIPVITTKSDASLSEAIDVGVGVDRFDIMTTLADSADVWLYCDARRVWHIADRPVGVGASKVQLTTGAAGIVTNREASLSRETWGNAVTVEFLDRKFGYASVSSGPFSTSTVGVCTYRVSKDAPYPGAARANAVAQAVLSRVFTRGSKGSITALAAWWLKPGDTVTTPEGQRVLCSSVRFTFPNALMQVDTRSEKDEI